MKRTPLRRKTPLRSGPPPKYRRKPKPWRRPDEDKVTDEVIARVDQRDGPCVAPRIDKAERGKCWGRTTYDHIHEHAGGTKGVRAKSDHKHLVAVCQGHSEDGRRKGRQWNTANRPAIRDWIRSHP